MVKNTSKYPQNEINQTNKTTCFRKSLIVTKTSRDRPKSAPYPRLNISKKTSKCQVFSYTVLENRKFFEKKFFEKITYSKKWTESHNAKKLKRGTLWGFSTSILTQNSKKIEGGAFGEKNSNKKSRSAEKNERGDLLVSPGMVCYAEKKQEKHFWFSSLGQIVQFGAIIFCRTFKNYFGQFVWMEKRKSHYNSRVSLDEAPTKNLSEKHQKGDPLYNFAVPFCFFFLWTRF